MAEAVNLTSVRRLIDDTRSALATWEQKCEDAQDDVRATNDELALLKDAIKRYVLKASSPASPAFNSSGVSEASEMCDCIITDINTLLVDSINVPWGLAEKFTMKKLRDRLKAPMQYFTFPPRTVGNANRPPPMNSLPQGMPRPAPPRQPAQRQPHQQNWQLPLPNQHPIPPRPTQAQEQYQPQRNIPRQPFQINGQPPLNQRPIPPQAQQAQGQQQNWGNGARQPFQRNGQPPLNQHPIPPQAQQAQGQQQNWGNGARQPFQRNGQPPLNQRPIPPQAQQAQGQQQNWGNGARQPFQRNGQLPLNQRPIPPGPFQQAQGQPYHRDRQPPATPRPPQDARGQPCYGNGQPPIPPQPPVPPQHPVPPRPPQQACRPNQGIKIEPARQPQQPQWPQPQRSKPEPFPVPGNTPQVAGGYKHAIGNNTGFVSRRQPNPPIVNGGHQQQNHLGVPNKNPPKLFWVPAYIELAGVVPYNDRLNV